MSDEIRQMLDCIMYHRRENAALLKNVKNAADRLLKLERENAALREDKARLDWIACGFSLPMFLDGKWHCFEGEFSTFREAIDAERKEAQP